MRNCDIGVALVMTRRILDAANGLSWSHCSMLTPQRIRRRRRDSANHLERYRAQLNDFLKYPNTRPMSKFDCLAIR